MQKRPFTTEFPSPTVPVLPEYFKKNTFEGMAPDATVFPYPYHIKSDTQTGILYLKTKDKLDDDDHNPDYIGFRAGVKRVFQPIDGELIDGFVADLRLVRPGTIDSEVIHVPEEASEFDVKYAENNRLENGMKPLLAVVFSDPDGALHFMGDDRLTDHVQVLMSEMDARTATPQAGAPASAPETPAGYIPKGEYFLG